MSYASRLGEVRAASYRQKVEDENARADFERVSGSSRSYKIFSKELASSQKEKPRTNNRGGRSNTRARRPFGSTDHTTATPEPGAAEEEAKLPGSSTLERMHFAAHHTLAE